MKIRAICDSDWNQVYQLIEDNMFDMQLSLGLKWDRESIITHFKKQSLLVAEHKNRLSGFIAYHQTDNAHFIDSLQVAQQYQHKLLGYRLVKTMLAHTSSSPTGQYIRCCVFENNPAKQLYFSAGFEEVSRSEGILRLQIVKDQLVKRFKLNESALASA